MTHTFIISRTYETIVEIDAPTLDEALEQLSQTDIATIELEQCCVVDEIVTHENQTIKDINFTA